MSAVVVMFGRFGSCAVVVLCQSVTCSTSQGSVEVEDVRMHIRDLQVNITNKQTNEAESPHHTMSVLWQTRNIASSNGTDTWIKRPFNSNSGDPSSTVNNAIHTHSGPCPQTPQHQTNAKMLRTSISARTASTDYGALSEKDVGCDPGLYVDE